MEKEVTIKRTFDAPRELVFKAWTDPKLLSQWWGLRSFTIPTCEIEPRPGGKLLIIAHGPKGTEYDIDMTMTGVFKEFDPPRQLTILGGALPDGTGAPQLVTLNTVSLKEVGGKTEMTLYITLAKATPVADAEWDGMAMGWNQSLDKLAAYLVAVQATT